jgi:hypothetical protein
MRKYLQFFRNFLKYIQLKFSRVDNSDQLIERHFSAWSETNHQCLEGLRVALELLNNNPSLIVETGTSAYGTDSSRLFDSYITRFGGRFYSVDINPLASRRLTFQHSRNSHFVVSDSLIFLENFQLEITDSKIDLVYLDSWDVDWSNPNESAIHGYNEYLRIKDRLKSGSVLVIDDTPRTIDWIPPEFFEVAQEFLKVNGVLPGKGALILKELQGSPLVKKIWHEYNLVFQLN